MNNEDKLKVVFDNLEHGWIILKLSCGEVQIEESVSYVLFDFIATLVRGLNVLVQGLPQEIEAYLEPAILKLCFTPEGENTLLMIYEDKTLILEITIPSVELLTTFWRALRRLQGRFSEEEFLRRWGHPFPTREMEILTQFIKTEKTNND